jgi:WD40 repeat protein
MGSQVSLKGGKSMISSAEQSTATSAAQSQAPLPPTITRTINLIEDSKLPQKKNISLLKFNKTGTLVAVVKAGGKSIYILDVESGKVKVKLYRGFKSQEVSSLDFSYDNRFLILITKASKIHIFHFMPALRAFDDK